MRSPVQCSQTPKIRSVTVPGAECGYQSGNKDNLGYQIVDVGQYPAPDIAMSAEADFMLAVCDGKSPRVSANLQRMPENRIRLIQL